MTLKDTELFGNMLVRNLIFRRSRITHNEYYAAYQNIGIDIKFFPQGNQWAVEIIYRIDTGTNVVFTGTTLNIYNIFPDADKLIGMFYFIRS